MHRLPFSQQIAVLGSRASSRQIPANDRYLEVYPELLQSIQALLPLDRPKLLLTAHAVFGWMPTQLRVNMGQVNPALAALNRILVRGGAITTADLMLLASTFGTIKGTSVVSASKILHFLAPDRFPIWDRWVAATWGLPPRGPQGAAAYLGFTDACHRFIGDPGGQQACQTLRQRLATAGYRYPMGDLRLIELIFFLP